MKVIDKFGDIGLSEISHGRREVKIAFCNRNRQETIMPFVKCKDFLSDALWAKFTGNDVNNMFGFSFKKDQDEGLFDKPRITVAVKIVPSNNKSEMEKLSIEEMANIVSLLNKIGSSNGFGRSVGVLSEDKNHFIISFDRKWIEVPYVASSLFMLIRLGLTYDRTSDIKEYYKEAKKFISPNDQMYLKTTIDIIEDMQKGFIDKTQKWSDYKTVNDTHCNSGICGYKKRYKKLDLSQPVLNI